METSNLKEQEKDLVDKLLLIREDYKNTKEQLALSIRKDLLLVELKDILNSSNTYYGLKDSLEDYIRKLEDEINGNKEQ